MEKHTTIDHPNQISPQPGVNLTNILWAAFVPKSFHQKITNPNCKHLKAAKRTLVWLSISPIFYKQLFHTKVLCEPFMCLQFGFVIFWRKDFGAKAAHKMLVKLTPDFPNWTFFTKSRAGHFAIGCFAIGHFAIGCFVITPL